MIRRLRQDAPDVGEWTAAVHPLEQRLRLRLDGDDPVVCAYRDLRLTLVKLADSADEAEIDALQSSFDAQRDRFLDLARQSLAAMPSDKVVVK
jgi:hypothetical protein